MTVEFGWTRLLVLDGNLEAGVCKVVVKGLAVTIGDALESIRTGMFVNVGRRADAVLYSRRSCLIVIVVVAIAIFGGAGVPSALTMK